MATKLGTKPSELYDTDFYVWSEVQAELLRKRQFDALDIENLIEEVEDLGGALKRSVLNNASVIIEHLLKLQFSPATEPRAGWVDSVLEHRRRLEFDLTPRLLSILEDELPRVYVLARRDTDRKLRLHGEHAAADALPAACPYSLDQITGDWWP
jgi:hypothetical protein